MSLNRKDYSSPDDFLAMQSLCQRVWPTNPRWHVGELAWSRFAIPGTACTWRTALWWDGDLPVAWGWAELPCDLGLLVDPARPVLVPEVLEWFDEVAGDGEHTCVAVESESAVIDALTGAGFSTHTDGSYFRYHTMPLDSVEDPVLPEGFRLRHVESGEAELRARVHRAGWSDFGSRVSTESYRDVMSAWPYRPELDWMVEAPDGEPVASALGWLDDVNRAGLLEPVGCAPSYRRRGLARAVSLACLRGMRAAGAETAHVNPRGDDAYPVPGLLYRSIGFQPGARTITLRRKPRAVEAPPPATETSGSRPAGSPPGGPAASR